MKKIYIFMFLVVIASFAVGFYFYPQLPDKVVSHWDFQSVPNGHMSKFWGAFLMPIISVAMLLLFLVIPKIDPLKENIKKFRPYFDNFIALIFVFLLYVHILTLYWNIGHRFDIGIAIFPALAVVFYYAGILIGKAQRNWFIGIRTPWTLQSENVWNKTHKLGAELFKIIAIIFLGGLFFPKQAIWIIVIPVFVVVIWLVVYSYIEYQHEKRN